MSSCNEKEFGPLRELYLADLLSEEEKYRFELHLMSCDECFRTVEEYNDVSLFLLNSREIKEETARLSKRSDHTPAGHGRRSGRLVRMVLAVAAVLVLLVVRPWRLTFEPADEAVAAEDRIALMPFRLSSPSLKDDWLEGVATKLLLTHLTEARPKQVISGEQIDDALASVEGETDSRRVLEAGHRLRARWLCDSWIKNVEPVIELEVAVIDLKTDDTLSVLYQAGDSTDNMMSVTGKLAVRLDDRIRSFEGKSGLQQGRLEVAYTDRPLAFRYYLEGISEYDKFYFDSAADRFHKCLEIDSTVAMAWYYLSLIEDTRLISKAMEYYSHATPLDKLYIRARARLLDGDSEGYKEAMGALLAAYPFERAAYVQLAGTEARTGNYAAAEEHLTQLLRIDPFYRLAYNQLAYVSSRQNDIERALEYVDKYEALVPNEANPYDTRGDILSYHGLVDSAISCYRRALSLNPEFSASRNKLADLLVYQGRYEAAKDAYHQPFSEALIQQDPTAALGLVNIPAHQGRFHEADVMLSKWIETVAAGSDQPDLRNQMTSAYIRRALMASEIRPDSAARVIRSAMDLLEPYSEPHLSRLTLYYVMFAAEAEEVTGANLDSIVELYRRGLEYNQDRFATPYRFVAGWVDCNRELYAPALEHLNMAATAPFSADAYAFRLKYGEALLMAEYPDSAVTVLENLVHSYDQGFSEFFAWSARAHYYLGLAYEATGQIDKAREQYEQILRIWKDADLGLVSLRGTKKHLEGLSGL